MGSVTFSVTAGFNSNGPFSGPPATTTDGAFADVTAPSGHSSGAIAPDPTDINGAHLIVFGIIGVSGGGGDWVVVCLEGVHPQNFFTNVTFIDGSSNNYNLASSGANFNDPALAMDLTGLGFTTWAWPAVASFVSLPTPITINWPSSGPPAVEWVPQTTGLTGNIAGVAWDGTRFVAVTTANEIATSADGVNWQIESTPFSPGYAILAVCFGGGQFVAVANTGVSLVSATSPDGSSWVSISNVDTNAPSAPGYSIAYGNGVYVLINLVSSSVASVWTSPDGATWTASSDPSIPNGWGSIIFDGTEFVWGTATVGYFSRSTDGIVWTTATPSNFTIGGGVAIAHNPASVGPLAGLYIGCDFNPITETTATANFAAFTEVTTGLEGGEIFGFTFDGLANGLVVGVGYTSAFDFARAAVSLDGASFSLEDLHMPGHDPAGVVYGAGAFLAFGSAGAISTRGASSSGVVSRIFKLTKKLLLRLHRVFDKDPHRQLALRLQYDGTGMTWSIENGVLSTTVTGGTGANQTIQLQSFTIATLAAKLASLPGYSVPYQDGSEYAQLGALVLIDDEGDIGESNGDHLYGYTNPLWSYLEAAGAELGTAQNQINNMLAQMAVPTAEEEWLDEHGSYYVVPRSPGESDIVYKPRIISEVTQPKGNNVAIAMAIQSSAPLAQTVRVIDAINDLIFTITYNGLIHYDGNAFYDAGIGPNSGHGFFDVDFSYDFTGPVTQDTYLSIIEDTVEKFRDYGTQLRGVIFRNNGSNTLIVSDSIVGNVRVIVYDDFSTGYRLLESGLVRLLEDGSARLLE